MGYELLLEIIEYVGPLALFLVLCLGLIGLPIPNEAVALTGGAIAESGIIHEALSFIMLWLGMCSAMSFNYSLGRFTSSKLSKKFTKQQKGNSFIDQAEKLIDKYGIYAVAISVFFPFIRHATPYIMGMNRLKYVKFALVGFPAAMLWTSIYYTLGHFVGDRIPEIIIIMKSFENGFYIIFAVIIVLLALMIWKKQKLAKKNMQHNGDNHR